MTLRERFDKLEPRERRLLTILGSILAAFVVLAGPVGVYTMVSSRRAANQELRDVIDTIYSSRTQILERKARHDALVARYAKPAPPLAGFIESAASANGLTAAESQDRPEAPHGKRYSERMTVVKMHKINMLPLLKTLEKIEQSGHPVMVSRLHIKPRSGEPDSYEVELGVSAYDRKPDARAPASTATAAPSTPPDQDKEP
jgi:general secretion pathway protein M